MVYIDSDKDGRIRRYKVTSREDDGRPYRMLLGIYQSDTPYRYALASRSCRGWVYSAWDVLVDPMIGPEVPPPARPETPSGGFLCPSTSTTTTTSSTTSSTTCSTPPPILPFLVFF